MYIEHIVYSLACAIVAVMLLKPREAGWCTLIVVVSGCIPDIDGIFDIVRNPPDFTSGLIPHMVEHSRYFHTMGALLVYALLAGIVLVRWKGLKFSECAFFGGAGFTAHLLEDALVYNPSSAVFWPLSPQEMGIGLLPHTRDFFSIASTEVLLVGIALLMGAVGTSMFLKKMEWAGLPWPGGTPMEIPFVNEMLRLSAKVPFPDESGEYESPPER
ncbi:MAG TPA: metal-dependent hydrolase [Methanoregula sp.]|nr:metal-dependent hydrolase [Methanoregula sp.]